MSKIGWRMVIPFFQKDIEISLSWNDPAGYLWKFFGGQRNLTKNSAKQIMSSEMLRSKFYTPELTIIGKCPWFNRKYINSSTHSWWIFSCHFSFRWKNVDPTALPWVTPRCRVCSTTSRNRSVERMHGKLQASKAQAQKTSRHKKVSWFGCFQK